MKVYSSTSSFQQASDGSYQAVLMIEQAQVSYYTPDGTLDEALDPTVARADIVVATYTDAGWTAQTAEHLTKE
ncbi:hypothetical protein CVV68_14675 [Arthrobacter livingstonensis]|uniref:Uncharacterized protein n=2 Tax=Arthrobacter livingstonensis TaxID=670078 RepID=A0A2V5LHS1_9MICC|nr:hypothetical protein CVV68_14675 [Arthrobacter livingstonensis]